MKKIPDNKVMEYLLAGQVIFAHKTISAGLIALDEAADLLEMDTDHLLQLFKKLGLSEPEKVMTFEEMLDGFCAQGDGQYGRYWIPVRDMKSLYLSMQC